MIASRKIWSAVNSKQIANFLNETEITENKMNLHGEIVPIKNLTRNMLCFKIFYEMQQVNELWVKDTKKVTVLHDCGWRTGGEFDDFEYKNLFINVFFLIKT